MHSVSTLEESGTILLLEALSGRYQGASAVYRCVAVGVERQEYLLRSLESRLGYRQLGSARIRALNGEHLLVPLNLRISSVCIWVCVCVNCEVQAVAVGLRSPGQKIQ